MARLVEVWDYFRAPMSENDMIRMRRTFSIINLDKCTFEFQLPPRWPEGGLCAIVFYYKKKMIHKEECSARVATRFLKRFKKSSSDNQTGH